MFWRKEISIPKGAMALILAAGLLFTALIIWLIAFSWLLAAEHDDLMAKQRMQQEELEGIVERLELVR